MLDIGEFYITEQDQLAAVFAADLTKLDVPLRRRFDRIDCGGIHPDDIIENGASPAVTMDPGKAAASLNHLDHRAGVAYDVFLEQVRR